MKDKQLEVFSSDLSGAEKKEIVRRCLDGEITHILVKDKITLGELEMLNIVGELTGVEIVVSYEVNRAGDIIAVGKNEITAIDHRRLLTQLTENLKQRLAYNIPTILKCIQEGDYDAIYDFLSIKSNSRLLKKSVKELRLADPKYRPLIGRSLTQSEMSSLQGLGQTAGMLGLTKAQLNEFIKSYKIMPDYMTKKGIIYFLPATIERFRAEHLSK